MCNNQKNNNNKNQRNDNQQRSTHEQGERRDYGHINRGWRKQILLKTHQRRDSGSR